jgi:5'(3')-deoxyribonucleotidase
LEDEMTLYLDLDGVLADFDKAAGAAMGTDNIYKYEFVWGTGKFWDKINDDPDFFRNLEVMPDCWDLLGTVSHLDPAILTAIPSTNGDEVARQKKEWVEENLGGFNVITCLTKDKPNFCQPGDILIDDRAVNRGAWIAKGGTYIIHTTAARSVGALQALGIID